MENYHWENLSVREAEILVKGNENSKPKKRSKSKHKDHQVVAIENRLIEILGTKVKIKSANNGGKIEISYFSVDDLDRIIDIISP